MLRAEAAGTEPPMDGGVSTGFPGGSAGGNRRGHRIEVVQKPTSPRLSQDDIFEVLSNPRHRAIVEYLRAEGGSMTRSNLVNYLAAKDQNKPGQEVPSSERNRVRTRLHQTHLPALDALNVVVYDSVRGTVRLRETAGQLEPYLDRSSRRVPVRFAFGLVGAVGTIVLLGLYGFGVFGVFSQPAWVGFGVIGLMGVGLVILRRAQRNHGKPEGGNFPKPEHTTDEIGGIRAHE